MLANYEGSNYLYYYNPNLLETYSYKRYYNNTNINIVKALYNIESFKAKYLL